MKILLIEDEDKIAEFVIKGFQAVGYEVEHVMDGATGLARCLDAVCDVVILDVMLPQLDGFEVLRQMRQQGSTLPVIVLSAKGELPDRLHGFEIGADDYLPKPFYVEELIARVKAVMLRRHGMASDVLTVQHLTLNKVTRQAHWFEDSAVLSQREFSLLEFLMRSPGHIYSRKQILQHVWDINFDPQTNVVDVCVQRIKRKLSRKNNEHMSPIESVRGVGYRIKMDDDA